MRRRSCEPLQQMTALRDLEGAASLSLSRSGPLPWQLSQCTPPSASFDVQEVAGCRSCHWRSGPHASPGPLDQIIVVQVACQSCGCSHKAPCAIEDNDEVAALVSEMLRELGYEVERVTNGPAALEVLAAGGVSLVFSDIMMPGGMDGVELGRQIRLRSSNIPVLLTSAYAHGAVQRAESEGFRVLAKPYDLASLARALRGVSEDRIGNVVANRQASHCLDFSKCTSVNILQ